MVVKEEEITLGIVHEKVRKTLSGDSLFKLVREYFDKNIKDHRASNASIPLIDAIMSGLALYTLKEPSLLTFEDDFKMRLLRIIFTRFLKLRIL